MPFLAFTQEDDPIDNPKHVKELIMHEGRFINHDDFKIYDTDEPDKLYMRITKDKLTCCSRKRINFYKGESRRLQLVQNRCPGFCGPVWQHEPYRGIGESSKEAWFAAPALSAFRYAARWAFCTCTRDRQRANVTYTPSRPEPANPASLPVELKVHGRRGASHASYIEATSGSIFGLEHIKADPRSSRHKNIVARIRRAKDWRNVFEAGIKGALKELIGSNMYHVQMARGVDEIAILAAVYCLDEQKEIEQKQKQQGTGISFQ